MSGSDEEWESDDVESGDVDSVTDDKRARGRRWVELGTTACVELIVDKVLALDSGE